MKYYKSYMDRQEISPAVHEKLLDLELPKKRTSSWLKYGALAACAALIIGVSVWRLSPAPAVTQNPAPAPAQSQVTADHTPVETDAADNSFMVHNHTYGQLMFPMIPGILYQDITDQPEAAADRVYYEPGSFTVDLTKEDIQKLFWGSEGAPGGDDLPWILFWNCYTLQGYSRYDSQGHLTELTIWGELDRASFELELRLGALPFTCCVDMSRGDQISEFNGVEIAGWSKVYDRDGDGQTDYICGSEFMTKNDIGVRFVNQNNMMQAESGEGEPMDLSGPETFNTLFVRQALTEDGGLYLDHLMSNENIPAWREEEFSTLAQARQEADFAPYLPLTELTGYNEFYSNLSYQEGVRNRLFVRWSRGYDNVEVCVYRDGYYPYHLVDPDEPESYDLRLYPIPWCDSVPDEYRETVNDPAFRAEDMSLEIVEARGREHDTGGMTYSFNVLHPDGTLVSYHCDGMRLEAVWALVEETL